MVQARCAENLDRNRGCRAVRRAGKRRSAAADQIDPDRAYATSCARIEAIGYNSKLVRPEDAPRSYAGLLDPEWQGKIVKRIPTTAARS
jgi:ABC-type Fe3+ transport system substrate-binding protein